MFRPQPISSTEARKYFTKIINKVQFSSKSFVIKSYRQPIVRVVNENYIRTLEEVIGKKTVNQVLQIASNDRLFEAEKIEQIKKVFQRRLSGSPSARPQPQSRPQQPQKPKSPQPQSQQKPATPKHRTPRDTETQKRANVVADSQSAQKPKPRPKDDRPLADTPQSKPNNPQKNKGLLLLQNGKNYQ